MTDVNGIKEKLAGIVGPEKVLDDEEVLERYSQDQSFVTPRSPFLVVYPTTDEEIQQVVRLANLEKFPVVPYSSGALQQGTSVPRIGGSVVVDLSRMNKIIDFDVENRTVAIEPGVTFAQLQEAANKEGLRVCTPVGLPANASVLLTYIEFVPLYSWSKYGTWFLLPFEVVLPNGEKMGTGSWAWANSSIKGASPVTIGAGLSTVYIGAQGTLGIVTKGRVVLKNLNEAEEVYFFPFAEVEKITPSLHKILRTSVKGTGEECFIVDRKNLYQLIYGTWPESPSLTNNLPPWTVVLVLSGTKGEVEYQREDMMEIAQQNGIEVKEDLPGVPDVGRRILGELRVPKGFYQSEKWCYHPLQFYVSARMIPAALNIFENLLEQSGYPRDRVGYLLLPVEKGRVYYCEYGVRSEKDGDDRKKTQEFWIEVAKALLDAGAYFDRPYGPLEELVYARAGIYHSMVKKIKGLLDPNHIMNTGRLY
ncbi:MAG: hypothetical protein DRG25_00910 [Deltaproteobacteria bacterium]|nr:MAG: hypothetical protein DRG25_00910 [Deltaproteobacteria bacterium]